MNILSLGLDSSALDPSSKTAERLARYGTAVGSYVSVVPAPSSAVADLAPNVRIYGSGGMTKLTRLFRTYRLAARLARERRYDVITVQDAYYLALIASKIARRFSLGFEVQIHGFERYEGARRSLARKNILAADHIRAVSERLKREIVAEFGVDQNKISVAPIYTDAAREECPPKDERELTFLTVSRLVPVKNVALQIEAFAEVAKRHPESRLVVVGEGPEKKNLKLKIKNLKLEDRVSLEGRQEDVSRYYCKADVFLLTSNREGWGLVAVEAAAYGLPIVMTDVGCAGEFVKNGDSGIVIPVGDRESLAAAMERLASSRAERDKLGRGARAASLRLPSASETLRRYVEGWNKCMKR